MSFDIENYQNKATDLGRSAQLIEVSLQYARNLTGQNLPVLFSREHMAACLGMSLDSLLSLITYGDTLYKVYEISKRRGGKRQIMSPHAPLRVVQNFILFEILNKVPVHRHAFGFVAGRSTSDNAKIHAGQPAIMNIDLFKFFDTITERRVYGIFKQLGYVKNLAWDLAKLVTVPLPATYLAAFSTQDLEMYNDLVEPGMAVLPQGAPTSPTLANLVLRKMDHRLTIMAEKRGVNYSRYADDLTFSGSQENLLSFSFLRRIIHEEGFYVHPSKGGIFKKGRRQTVTGLTVSDGVHVPRAFKKEVAKHLRSCLRFGVQAHLEHLGMAEKGFYREWLFGKIAYVNSVEPVAASKLFSLFNTVDWQK